MDNSKWEKKEPSIFSSTCFFPGTCALHNSRNSAASLTGLWCEEIMEHLSIASKRKQDKTALGHMDKLLGLKRRLTGTKSEKMLKNAKWKTFHQISISDITLT